MGRRPIVWRRDNSKSYQRFAKKDKLHSIAKFDIEKLELLPFTQKRRISPTRYGQNYDHLIQRFLESKIGCDYNDVYSELCQRVPLKYRHQWKYSSAGRRYAYKMPSAFHTETPFWAVGQKTKLVVNMETRCLCLESEPQPIRPKLSGKVYRPFKVSSFIIRACTLKQLLTKKHFELQAKEMHVSLKRYWKICRQIDDKISTWVLGNSFYLIQLTDKTIVKVWGIGYYPVSEFGKEVISAWAKSLQLTIGDAAFL